MKKQLLVLAFLLPLFSFAQSWKGKKFMSLAKIENGTTVFACKNQTESLTIEFRTNGTFIVHQWDEDRNSYVEVDLGKYDIDNATGTASFTHKEGDVTKGTLKMLDENILMMISGEGDKGYLILVPSGR